MKEYKKRIKFSITKYNPIYRNELGHFQNEEWTSITDIGETFEGNKLTYDEYVKVENKYIESIFTILDFFKVKKIKIKHIYKFDKKADFQNYNDIELYQTYKSLCTNAILYDRNKIEDLIRLRLREHIAELELIVSSSKRVDILFGFDFYMYLITNRDISSLQTQIAELGLYVN
jgi:hypothetical protein